VVRGVAIIIFIASNGGGESRVTSGVASSLKMVSTLNKELNHGGEGGKSECRS